MLVQIANFLEGLAVLLMMGLVGWVGWLTKAYSSMRVQNAELRTEIANVRTDMANQLSNYVQNPEVLRMEDKIDTLQRDFQAAMVNIMNLLGEIKGRAAAGQQNLSHG